MSNRPGFLSVTGVLVAAIALVGLLALTLFRGPVLFSPGPLNARGQTQPLGGVTSHARLAGDCGACHAAPWSSQTMADRCLACHKDVNDQIQTRGGLHGGLVGGQASPTCRGCHPEHHGPTGALTVVDGPNFPHNLTGYSLRSHQSTAKGAKVTCTECHPKDLGHFDQAVCADCHATLDANFMSRHEATFGKECLPCHNGSDRSARQLRPQQAAIQADRQAHRRGLRAVPHQRRIPAGPAENAPGLSRLPRGRTTNTEARSDYSAGSATPLIAGATLSSTTLSSRSTTGTRKERPPARRATRPT